MESELTAPELRPPDSRLNASDREHSGTRSRFLWVWLLFTLLLVAAIAVILALPRLLEQKTPEQYPDSVPVAAPAVKIEETSETSTSLNGQEAAEALREFLRIRGEPDLAQAEVWASDEWQLALDTARAGDDLYGKNQFVDALSAYNDAQRQLNDILASRAQRFATYLSTGKEALDQNLDSAAISAFKLALAMTPESPEASDGLARAEVRGQVLTLMQAGRQAEDSNDPGRAVVAYTDAVSLDASYQPAKDALDRANAAVNTLDFDRAMSSALENLNAGRLADSEKDLNAAEKLKPNHHVVADARQRLQTARKASKLSGLRQQANSLISREDWKSASDVFSQAILIDAEASFAVSGLAVAKDRIFLHTQLDHYLDDPGRLSADEPLKNAKQLFESNLSIPESEPLLSSKLKALGEAIRLAEIPVTLLLQSDNQTEVTIYHVGRLGKFHEKEVRLRPGNYTVTGFCPGYRDVRKEIALPPGSGKTSMLLRCEEEI